MKLDWYFDFISPFAYLQHCQFNRLPKSIEINYKPILFAGLLKHWANVGPAEIPPKRTFTYKHCYWYARKNGIAFKMPPAHPFRSLNALRLAIACRCDPKAVQIIFETIWQRGFEIESNKAITYLKSKLKIDNFSNLVSTKTVKNSLIENTEEAASREIFGVPTFSIKKNQEGYENFWGLDSFEMMLDYLVSPEHFYDEQMKNLDNLPEGIQRKR